MDIVIRNGQPTLLTREAYSRNCCCGCPIPPNDWGTFPCAGITQSYQVEIDSSDGEGIGEVGASWYYVKWTGSAIITAVPNVRCWWEGVGGEFYFVPRDENGDGEPIYVGPAWYRLTGPTFALTRGADGLFELNPERCAARITIGYIEAGIRTNSVLQLEYQWDRRSGSPFPPGRYTQIEIFLPDSPVTPVIIS
jgi:hypothetical protein